MRRTVLTMCGVKQQYSFIHLSVQEYLAAIFISGLEHQEQAGAIHEVYQQNPLSPVLSFYAGITNLADSMVQDILFEVLRKDLNSQSVLRELISTQNSAKDTRRQLLGLANCLYEGQNRDLWNKVLNLSLIHI